MSVMCSRVVRGRGHEQAELGVGDRTRDATAGQVEADEDTFVLAYRASRGGSDHDGSRLAAALNGGILVLVHIVVPAPVITVRATSKVSVD